MGIKSEAVGRYLVAGEELSELSAAISEKANHFHIFYEYDHDIDKMVSLANEIKEKAENLARLTEIIAESAMERSHK